MRCASTSCISRAMRVRSAVRAWAMRAACSDSVVSARSRRFASSSRREPRYMPQPIVMAMTAATRGVVSCHGSLSPVGSSWTRTRLAARPTSPTGTISRPSAAGGQRDERQRRRAAHRPGDRAQRVEDQGDRNRCAAPPRHEHEPAEAQREIDEEPAPIVLPLPLGQSRTRPSPEIDEDDRVAPHVAPHAQPGLVVGGLHLPRLGSALPRHYGPWSMSSHTFG